MRMLVLQGGVGYVWKSSAKAVFRASGRRPGQAIGGSASGEGSMLIRGFFKGIGAVAIACLAVLIGVNAWVVLSSRGDIRTLDEALAIEAQIGRAHV